MPPPNFPLRWESTGDQWWYASPIDWAAASGHYDLVRELLYIDTNLLIKLTSLPRIRRLETVWDDDDAAAGSFHGAAACRSRVARKLLAECESGGKKNSLLRAGYGGWLLYTAASAGDAGFVRGLLEREPSLVFGEGEYGVTDILYAAARSRDCGVFRLLMEFSFSGRCLGGNGVELELEGGKGDETWRVFRWEMMNRAVHASARGGNVEILRELLGDCLDVLAYRDAQGATVLHSASGRGQVEVVKYILASYNIITATDNQGNTALNVAAYRGYLPVVEVLISASPSSTSLTNNYGDTFLHMAVSGFRTPGFRRLDHQIHLMNQLVRGKIVNIEDFVNIRNNDGRTPLHLAVIGNVHSDLVELLMTVPGINFNIRDSDGMTPLDLLKQRPRSASSEILIKQLISAGGISNCQDQTTRTALASHLKMQGIGGSPGTSFRISDAEIFLYTGIENSSNASFDPTSTEYSSCSGELSKLDSSENRKSSSVNNAARRLKILLRWPRRKERKENGFKFGDDDSAKSYTSRSVVNTPTPLRERFSKLSSFANNKRVLPVRNNLPSPLTRMRFSNGLMNGVIQTMPQSSVQSPSSPFSESSISSPISTGKGKGVDIGNDVSGPASLSHLFNGEKLQKNQKQSSFNKRVMNQYFCFGAQGLAVENSVGHRGPHQSYKRSSSLMA